MGIRPRFRETIRWLRLIDIPHNAPPALVSSTPGSGWADDTWIFQRPLTFISIKQYFVDRSGRVWLQRSITCLRNLHGCFSTFLGLSFFIFLLLRHNRKRPGRLPVRAFTPVSNLGILPTQLTTRLTTRRTYGLRSSFSTSWRFGYREG